MRQDTILYDRAKYFYEMSVYEQEAHLDTLKKDLNLRLAIGYTIGQSMELTLKQLLDDLEGEHPETHKIQILCERLERKLRKETKLSLVSAAKLKSIIKEISNNAALYGNLAYGARYVADIKLSMNQLDDMKNITKDLLLFYSTVDYGV